MMGISVKEYDELVSRFDRSGLKQAVNMHTFASDVLKIPENVPETVLGRAAQVAGNTATAKPVRGALNKYGFQAGEGFNVAASYMMAVRRRMKERKITDITKLTEDDWAHIQVRGSDYALAMHRANASQYQYGLLSLPMQFLSFTHKVFLTFLRAMPEKLGGTLGNKGFTKAEARKLLAGQFLLFGGAGFGVKDWTEKKLTDMGLDKYAGGAVVDLLSGGMLDMVLDASLQKVVDDPELDLPFDEFLAPGANIINVMRSFYEAGAEKAPVETLLGPSATTTSRLLEAAAYGFMLYDADETKWTTEEKLSMILDASLAGMATGYNNYLKGRLAWETGVMLSQSGVPHNYHATHAEAVAKGLIGINSSGAKDLWEMTKDIREKEKDLTEIAQTFHQRVLNLTQMYAGESTWSKEYFQNRLAMEKSLLQSLPPEERAFVLQKVREMEASRQPDKQGIADYIVQAVSKNIPTATEWLIYRMRESNAIDPEDLPALEELVRSSGKELAEAGEKMDLSLQQDKTTLDGLDDVPEIPLDFNRGTVTFGDRRSQEGGTQPPPPRASTAPSLSQQDREALAAKAKALPFGDLEGRAAIARQLGASEDDIQRILSKAPRSSK